MEHDAVVLDDSLSSQLRAVCGVHITVPEVCP